MSVINVFQKLFHEKIGNALHREKYSMRDWNNENKKLIFE